MARLLQAGECRGQQRQLCAMPVVPATSTGQPIAQEPQSTCRWVRQHVLKWPQPPCHLQWHFCINDRRKGAEQGKKSNCHEYSRELLSVLGVRLHVLCVHNVFLVGTGERVCSDGSFGSVVIIYYLCLRCTQSYLLRPEQPVC